MFMNTITCLICSWYILFISQTGGIVSVCATGVEVRCRRAESCDLLVLKSGAGEKRVVIYWCGVRCRREESCDLLVLKSGAGEKRVVIYWC
jgi:hypothetical protein